MQLTIHNHIKDVGLSTSAGIVQSRLVLWDASGCGVQTQHRDYVASTRQRSGINPPCTAQVMPFCVHLSLVHILHGHCDGVNGEPLMATHRVQMHEMALTMHARMSVWQDMPILSGTHFSSSMGSSEAAADHMTPSLRGPEISEETTLPQNRCEASLASPLALQAQCMVRLSIDQTRRDIMDPILQLVVVCVLQKERLRRLAVKISFNPSHNA